MSEEQEPFETIMRKMCASVLHDMQPHVVEAKQAEKQARAELRDRFAMAALTGFLAADHCIASDVARWSYEYADAMLGARGND